MTDSQDSLNKDPLAAEPPEEKRSFFGRMKDSFTGAGEDLASAEGFIDDEDIAPWQHRELTEEEKATLFQRLKEGLSKTGSHLGMSISNLVLGEKVIDEELLEEIEMQLLTADVGVEATQEIIKNLTDRMARAELGDGDALFKALQDELRQQLEPAIAEFTPETTDGSPYVMLMVGVNGVGKTTTIGKLAKQFQAGGKSVMLAAGDTFRAAAVEQLQVWGERNDVPVVAQHTGADSASVIFDAVQSAQSRGAMM